MFHEEKVIDGVLCWRGLQDSEWTAYDSRELTKRLQEALAKVDGLEAEFEQRFAEWKL